jgi:hypothetical protein
MQGAPRSTVVMLRASDATQQPRISAVTRRDRAIPAQGIVAPRSWTAAGTPHSSRRAQDRNRLGRGHAGLGQRFLLWIDRVEGISQAEVWLQVTTEDTQAAAKHLAAEKIVRRDEIEPLPEGFDGFWISSPASIIHLVCHPDS